ncbi:hypothetical protein QAD02_010760 [Eretmocerus hayati]|uniref:Uncharacterized protein n=1 Tax=Eretmocerus hayati TaxID=131215 RepID=A0ACC2NXG0_9HYME|nr:hypothetical protein QAD02_010760 [Eretmocerus hayati]
MSLINDTHNNNRKIIFQLAFESERLLLKKLKKDIGRDELAAAAVAAGVYNGNGLGGLYHPAAVAAAVSDPYYMRWAALFDLAAREASAFRPWNPPGSCKHRESTPMVPSFLSRGPPVLQHPERVVPMSEFERFEPHFQPNVALAPLVPGLPIADEDELILTIVIAFIRSRPKTMDLTSIALTLYKSVDFDAQYYMKRVDFFPSADCHMSYLKLFELCNSLFK